MIDVNTLWLLLQPALQAYLPVHLVPVLHDHRSMCPGCDVLFLQPTDVCSDLADGRGMILTHFARAYTRQSTLTVREYPYFTNLLIKSICTIIGEGQFDSSELSLVADAETGDSFCSYYGL